MHYMYVHACIMCVYVVCTHTYMSGRWIGNTGSVSLVEI